MRVVHAVSLYDLLTGSGLYVYELARVQAAAGHSVTVAAEYLGGQLTARTRDLGVDVVALDQVPTAGVDLIHVHQRVPGQIALERWPRARVVATVHSEWPGDAPLLSDRVRTYLAVRPTIQDALVTDYRIPSSRTRLVLNPIDRRRFHPRPAARRTSGDKTVLFAGAMGPARRPAVLDLVRRSVDEGFRVLLLGPGDPDLFGDLPANVHWLRKEVWFVEEVVAECDVAAGIFFSRSVIEGWMCGLPACTFDVAPRVNDAADSATGIEWDVTGVSSTPPPPEPLLSMCDAEVVGALVGDIYSAALA